MADFSMPALPAPAAVPASRQIVTRLGPVEFIDSGGAGPALLCLHGGMGGPDQSWLLGQALLDRPAGWRIIAVARPGYFGTPLAAGRTPADQADIYAALLDALGITSCVVAAVSAGGPSALEFPRRHGGRIRGLVLVSTASGRMATPERMHKALRAMGWMSRVPGLTALMARRAAKDPRKGAARSIPYAALRDATLTHPAAGPLLLALQASTFRGLRHRLPGTLNDTAWLDTAPAFPFSEIAVPTLVIHGDSDRVVPFAHAQASASIPGARLVIGPGGDHVTLFTHIEQVRRAMREFTEGLR